MAQKSKQTAVKILVGLIVLIYMVVLGFYDYKNLGGHDGSPENTQTEEPERQSAKADDTTPKPGPAAELSAEEERYFDLLAQVEATVSGASVDELIADLPAEIPLNTENLFVVNKQKPFEEAPAPDLITGQYGYLYAAMIQEPYEALTQAALEAGHQMVIVSAFRSIEQQQANRESMMAMYLAGGLSAEEAEQELNKYVAPANASEHTTGLALDVVDEWWYQHGAGLTEAYADRDSAAWLLENAPDFGFILRYPRGKEHFTGYNFEPWHYRFVGDEHARYIHKHGLTLEEYCLLAIERERRETGNLNLEALGSMADEGADGLDNGDPVAAETAASAL